MTDPLTPPEATEEAQKPFVPPIFAHPKKKKQRTVQKAYELYQGGVPVAEIAKQLRVTPACIYRWLKFGPQRHPNQRSRALVKPRIGGSRVDPELQIAPDEIDPEKVINPPPPGTEIPEIEEDPKDDGPEETERLIGMPLSSWTPGERSYIQEREIEIISQLGQANKGAARFYINEVISCDVNIQRLDAQIWKIRKWADLGKILKATAEAKLKPIKKEREEFMDRMTDAMNNLGIMPKNYVQQEPASSTMAELHARYRKELDARRQKGWGPGQIDPEAHALLAETGGIPENYSALTLGKEARAEIESKKDSEPPRP